MAFDENKGEKGFIGRGRRLFKKREREGNDSEGMKARILLALAFFLLFWLVEFEEVKRMCKVIINIIYISLFTAIIRSISPWFREIYSSLAWIFTENSYIILK